MKKQKDRIRPYTPGDEAKIITLKNEVFGSSTMNRKLWDWKYHLNPKGDGWINVAESGQEIVAQYALMRYNLNFLGDEIIASQSADTAVRKDQQRKGWMMRLARNIYDKAGRDGSFAVWGFPNRNIYPGVMRYLDFSRICNFSFYQYPIGSAGLTGRAIDAVIKTVKALKLNFRYFVNLKTSLKNGVVKKEEALPDDVEDLLQVINNYEVISVWKDRDYLLWRYTKHPDFKYEFFSLRVGGRLEGLIIARELGDRIAVCELLNRTKNIQQAFLHLLFIIKYYMPTRAQELFFQGHDNGYFDTVLGWAGFKKSISPVVCLCRCAKSGRFREMAMVPDNWTLVYGDTDLV